MKATKKEKAKASKLRMKVARLPKYLISTGIVMIPTIIRVEINAPICIYPAPFSNRSAAVGKATKPGINVIDPMIADKITPNHPESDPIILEMISGLSRASKKPTNNMTDKSSGSMLSKDFQAFLSAILVFFLSLT